MSQAIFQIHKKVGPPSNRIDDLIKEFVLTGGIKIATSPKAVDVEAEVFNYLVSKNDRAHPKARFFSTWALRIGYTFFAIPFLQNLLFVTEVTFFSRLFFTPNRPAAAPAKDRHPLPALSPAHR